MRILKQIHRLTRHSQCNSITDLWALRVMFSFSSAGVFTTVRLCNRADCELLCSSVWGQTVIFIPAVSPLSVSSCLCVTSQSDRLSFKHLFIRLYGHHSFSAVCNKITVPNTVIKMRGKVLRLNDELCSLFNAQYCTVKFVQISLIWVCSKWMDKVF